MVDFYSRLLELRRAEGATRGLAKIPSDLYPQAKAYLAEVRRTYETELRENPSGKKGEVARQTHTRAQQVARDLIEARITKIMSASFQSAVGGGRDLSNGLPEERALFEEIVEAIRSFRLQSSPYLEPTTSSASPTLPAGTPSSPASGTPSARTDPTTPAPPRPELLARTANSVQFVRILKGSPPVEMGGERLELRPEDLVSVTPEVARILVQGKVGEPVDAEARDLTP